MDYLQISEMYHWGILGQKWGVRRYQNEDGTLTSEGRERYSTARNEVIREHQKNEGTRRAEAKLRGNDKYTYKKLTNAEIDAKTVEKVKSQELEGTRQVLSGAQQGLNAAANALPTGNGKTVRQDYSDLSDEELRKRVNRLNLERQYGDLTGETKYVKSGSEWVRETLQTVGAIAAVGVSAVTIMNGINKFKGKG